MDTALPLRQCHESVGSPVGRERALSRQSFLNLTRLPTCRMVSSCFDKCIDKR